ncbi:efflux RND transporter permease subunit [Desulfovibrio sulfodismutans]|uniref:Efflux RND transporter permease subunit n=1 Tax=Desulfolutivibrio sulfodismutans TaxID=63561 RepID=A0A7K3NMM9_9BACT|nr:efflux RND transporter permease subunit [Desulfolutivibrio sulfodismutans]NDY56459.1 efflux RND transporter permease subunit [Desulfolutivibrio sulfodismutans]QLA12802.1 AcrB/AcrD/AcrF family protein [Desulfolutivibrio sulfodismutans DSM 3696]
MTMHSSDDARIAKTRNLARYFVENPHISAILLILVLVWGYFGLTGMPQRKDPYLAVRVAMVLCPWPGIDAERVELQVTRRLERSIAENTHVKRIQSTSRTGLSVITVELTEDIEETGEIFDDIDLRMRAVLDLPEGAGPVVFMKDFGDTAALMLTVASPPVSEVEADLRSREVVRVMGQLRGTAREGTAADRVSLAFVFSHSASPAMVRRQAESLAESLAKKGLFSDTQVYAGPNLVVLDGATAAAPQALRQAVYDYAVSEVHLSEISPDIWEPAVIRDPADARKALLAVAGSKYSYRQLEAYTDQIMRRLLGVPIVSKVTRWGVQQEAVYLEYSQERLSAYAVDPWRIKEALAARNVSGAGGVLEFGGQNLVIDPSGRFTSEQELGRTMVAASGSGPGAYLQDLVDMERYYRTPPENLNYFMYKDKEGTWRRALGITLAVNMRHGQKISDFSEQVDEALAEVTARLPEDLIMARTSDQPRQVEENVELFMEALGDAVWLVVLVSLIGFWEWRSALLMALSIPITLAMTFGMMHLMHLDLQQVSIASLILALGLLVDDPVVANDAIKRDLALGHPPGIAAWLGPTKLARAILFATITNCIAYLPFLLLKGDTGRYLFAMPVVITASLLASRLVSMSFIPFLGRYLLKPSAKPEPSEEVRRTKGFSGMYYRLGGFLIDHRYWVLLLSLLPLAGGVYLQTHLKPQFFPNDLSYLFYADVWLPEDAPIQATDAVARQAEDIIRETMAAYEAAHPGEDGKPAPVLKQVTTFVGGGGPRFWFSVSPEQSQPNYAQILIEVTDKWLTPKLQEPLQTALESRIPGARIDMRQLESGEPVGVPVQIRLLGEDMQELRLQAQRLKALLRALPMAYRVRDDWGSEIMKAKLTINPDKANLAGLTNQDVARSSMAAMNGLEATTLSEGRLLIPVITRLRAKERATLTDIANLYVYSESDPGRRATLGQVATLDFTAATEKIARRDQFRTIVVSCFPTPGHLPSEVVEAAMPQIETFQKELPPGIRLQIGGEHEKQVSGFADLTVVLAISVAGIYMALLFQFKNAVKPLIVFSAIPYGAAGAIASLYAMGSPFGFMAFLGIISLIGVIVSHVIVLFDFIEEKLEEGEDLRTALLDAGILRLRPVMITVGATVIALFPLATSGGPLWEPLCYAQIGGLTAATFITLLMVPVIYSIAAFDLKIIPASVPRQEKDHAA